MKKTKNSTSYFATALITSMVFHVCLFYFAQRKSFVKKKIVPPKKSVTTYFLPFDVLKNIPSSPSNTILSALSASASSASSLMQTISPKEEQEENKDMQKQEEKFEDTKEVENSKEFFRKKKEPEKVTLATLMQKFQQTLENNGHSETPSLQLIGGSSLLSKVDKKNPTLEDMKYTSYIKKWANTFTMHSQDHIRKNSRLEKMISSPNHEPYLKIQVTTQKDGTISSCTLLQSCGNSVIDNEIIHCIKTTLFDSFPSFFSVPEFTQNWIIYL